MPDRADRGRLRPEIWAAKKTGPIIHYALSSHTVSNLTTS